jgi:hypothetical protein
VGEVVSQFLGWRSVAVTVKQNCGGATMYPSKPGGGQRSTLVARASRSVYKAVDETVSTRKRTADVDCH